MHARTALGDDNVVPRGSHVPRDTVLIFEHLRDLVLRKKMRCSMSHLIMQFVLLLYLLEVSEVPRNENCVSGDIGNSGCVPLLSVRRGWFGVVCVSCINYVLSTVGW